MFIIILPQYEDEEEEKDLNDGIGRLLFYLYLLNSSLPYSQNQPPLYLNSVFQSNRFFHTIIQNFNPTLRTQYRGHSDLMWNLLLITPS